MSVLLEWMHRLDANEMHEEKAGWEPYKNAMCSFEQKLETTSQKTVAVWSLTFNLTKHPSKMNNKDLHTSVLCGQKCSLEDQQEAMNDRDGWRESQ